MKKWLLSEARKKTEHSSRILPWRAALEAPGLRAGAREMARVALFVSAGKALRAPGSRVWYHDSPRVLSVPKPTLTERIEVHKTGKIFINVAQKVAPALALSVVEGSSPAVARATCPPTGHSPPSQSPH